MMKNFAIAAFLAVALAFVVFMAGANARADEVAPEKINAEQAFPAEDAMSTVAVVDHSGLLYSMWLTMKDGRVLCFDQRSPMSWEDQITWAKAHGGHVVTVTAPYTLIGGEPTAS